MPTVSVIIPSYNHEKFVRECIQSVLNQTFQDFEIIITDDASTDRTVEIIEQFDDPRIKLFKHSTNKGVSITANNCIIHANGKYIAWLSTDDAWYPTKLDLQVRYLEEHPEIGAVFGKVDWIDESGNLITENAFPYLNTFNVHNRNRYEWLRYFFLTGNCLSLPSSLVRRECFDEVGLFNATYAKIPDLDLWIRICFRYDISILDQPLIRNRWINDESNASGDTLKNRIQVRFEYRHSLNHYLKISNPDELSSIFPDAGQYGELTVDTIPYILGRIAIANNLDFKMVWGLDVIYALLQGAVTAKILENKCSFTYLDFINLSSKCDSFNLEAIVHLAEKEQTMQDLVAHITEKQQVAQDLLAQLAEKQQVVQDLLAQSAERQQVVQDLLAQLAEKQQVVQNLTAQLHEVNNELEAIKNSRYWRYAEFLRRLRG
jgi:glycosyltransferase involved in cell wall biosynthesis